MIESIIHTSSSRGNKIFLVSKDIIEMGVNISSKIELKVTQEVETHSHKTVIMNVLKR